MQYVEWVKQTLKLIYEFVNQNLQRADMRQKKNYDRGVKPRTIEAGSFVWRWFPPRAGLKLGLGWTGPFLVKQKLTDVLYRIQKSSNQRTLVVHVDHLKPYLGENVPEIWQNESEVENEVRRTTCKYVYKFFFFNV